MEAKALEIKGAITAAFGILGLFLGWKGLLTGIWLGAMVLDYITGSLAARSRGEWDSAVARAGLWHKGGMIAVIFVAALFDGTLALVGLTLPMLQVTWPGVAYPVVLVFYIITEAGSVLENAIKMGAPVPEWLAKGLKITLRNVDKIGNETVSKLDKNDTAQGKS